MSNDKHLSTYFILLSTNKNEIIITITIISVIFVHSMYDTYIMSECLLFTQIIKNFMSWKLEINYFIIIIERPAYFKILISRWQLTII